MSVVSYSMKTNSKTQPTASECQKFGITPKGVQWIKENGYDGHSILMAEGVPFSDLGLTDADRKRLVQTYRSDTSSPKSTIFKDGRIVPECEGVYLLPLWQAIAAHMKLDDALARAGMLFGRGSAARVLCDAILSELEPVK